MATPNPSFNPMAVTNAAGMFQLESEGLVQGFAMPDPATRNSLAQGIVSANATQVLWGGCAILENIPANQSLGPIVDLATDVDEITGFIVTNQAYNGIITPSSAPQQYGSNMSTQFQRLGSGARIVVGIEPVFAASIIGGDTPITASVAWDFDNQRLTAVTPTHTTIAISGITTATIATGALATVTTAAPHGLADGDEITISGSTPTDYNGTWIIDVTGASTFTFEMSPYPAAYTSGAVIDPGTAPDAIPVKILRVNIGNSQTISIDNDDNLQWDPNGSAAVILI